MSHAASTERPLIIDRLQQAAERDPEGLFRVGHDLTQPGLTHAGVWVRTGAIASWLIAQGYGPQSAPVAILSNDSLERALFFLGCFRAGVTVADLSLPGNVAGLDQAFDTLKPALVFAQDSGAHGAALDRARARRMRIVTVDGKRGLALAALTTCSIDASVAERRLHLTADAPAEAGA